MDSWMDGWIDIGDQWRSNVDLVGVTLHYMIPPTKSQAAAAWPVARPGPVPVGVRAAPARAPRGIMTSVGGRAICFHDFVMLFSVGG